MKADARFAQGKFFRIIFFYSKRESSLFFSEVNLIVDLAKYSIDTIGGPYQSVAWNRIYYPVRIRFNHDDE